MVPSIVGIIVYFVIHKLFPEKLETSEKTPLNSIRGDITVGKNELLKNTIKKLLNDRALKIALISIFAASGYQHFQTEIERLLIKDVFKQICNRNVDGDLKIVCDIIEEQDLSVHTKSIKGLLIDKNLTDDQKISLLKIKLDFIVNVECPGKKRFLVVAIIAAIISCSISGVSGLALLLDGLYRLFKEGKISKALYTKTIKAVAKNGDSKKYLSCFCSSSMVKLYIIHT